MAVVIFYILFVPVCILTTTHFLVLGLVPMNYFVAATGSAIILYIHRAKFLKTYRGKAIRGAIKMVLIQLLTISLLNLDEGLGSSILRGRIGLLYNMTIFECVHLAMLISHACLFQRTIEMHRDSVFYEGLLAASGTGFLRFLLLLIVKNPPLLLWRYSGLFDILMISGWLLFLKPLIEEDVRHESSLV